MNLTQFPNCCSVNIIHCFYALEWQAISETERQFKSIVKKAKQGEWPTSVTLIVLNSKQYDKIEHLLIANNFKIILKTTGAHEVEIIILAKNWNEK